VRQKHTEVASSPVIPFDDPTILFTNAGMNQFKDVFTGNRTVAYSRATSAQKCIRAGGKHNDLDNVGFTSRHHTFFEMLGNFSFGDYYKEEAILFAWDWVTKEIKLPKVRLYATVYETDDEAFGLWGKIAPELKNGRIIRFGKKDNFWSMGEVGPCGPCSEIHFDRGEKYGTGPNDTVNGETDRFVEIWNLVFMQDDQLPDGRVVPLPKPSVDTGAGLERIAAILQQADTNYGIDLFQSIIAAVSEVTGSRYADNRTSHHVIADHIRALTFALADGAGISNESRGYVLRRILRRAVRHGRLLGSDDPFLYKLVPALVQQMGAAYPEIREKENHIVRVIRTEEEAFDRTLDRGLEHFDRIVSLVLAKGERVIPGEEVFRLYDTFGFPYDLTEIIAMERDLTLDQAGFESAMQRQQVQSRAGSTFQADKQAIQLVDELESRGLATLAATTFVRERISSHSSVLLGVALTSEDVALVLDRTPFYVESGGQVSDIGTVSNEDFTFEVKSLLKHQDIIIHRGKLTRGSFRDVVGASVTAQVAEGRRWDIMRNHTATHLAHAALRKVLGDHVHQSGSYVGPDRLRFDFSHHQPMTPEEIREVERLVNEQILKGTDVTTDEMNIDDAKKSGAMALFGEKYGEIVRVVSVPGFSKELCGGTHVSNVSQIGPFFVSLETGIASGVRRMEAITGREAINYMLEAKAFRQDVARLVNRPESEALAGVEQLREANTSLQKELKKTREEMFKGGGGQVGNNVSIGGLTLATNDFGSSDRDTMGAWLDRQKEAAQPVLAIALGTVSEKRTFMAAASSAAVQTERVNVGSLAREILPKFGGRGGGKPNFAQGGIADETDAGVLFEAVEAYLKNGRG
jgi:alanyl-tRNA synthetase